MVRTPRIHFFRKVVYPEPGEFFFHGLKGMKPIPPVSGLQKEKKDTDHHTQSFLHMVHVMSLHTHPDDFFRGLVVRGEREVAFNGNTLSLTVCPDMVASTFAGTRN